MRRQYQAKQSKQDVIEHLVDRGPFLEDVVTNQQTEHEREPAVNRLQSPSVGDQSKTKTDLDERDHGQVTVDQQRRKADPQVALKEVRVIVAETAAAEKLADSGAQQDDDHCDANDAFGVLESGLVNHRSTPRMSSLWRRQRDYLSDYGYTTTALVIPAQAALRVAKHAFHSRAATLPTLSPLGPVYTNPIVTVAPERVPIEARGTQFGDSK